MVYRLLCDENAAQQISFGGIVGGFPRYEPSKCGNRPRKQVPFIHLHGSGDTSVKYYDQQSDTYRPYSRWKTFSQIISKCGANVTNYTATSSAIKPVPRRKPKQVRCQQMCRDGRSAFCTIVDMHQRTRTSCPTSCPTWTALSATR
mmetsp:Transcript_6252/g.14246  ORF Transcript_6252/g.14246 Transcript_6252/m.14246 type:complete len:146 (-) Transcript_6252:250-687(-)